MEDLLNMLDDLTVLTTEEPRTIVGPLTYGLDKREVTEQIEKIRRALPVELANASHYAKQAQILKEQAESEAESLRSSAKVEVERILNEAQEEANRMIEAAKIQQERLVAESQILKLGRTQVEAILASAEADAAHLRNEANTYAAEVLVRLDANIEKISKHVKEARMQLDRVDIPNKGSQARPTERIRV